MGRVCNAYPTVATGPPPPTVNALRLFGPAPIDESRSRKCRRPYKRSPQRPKPSRPSLPAHRPLAAPGPWPAAQPDARARAAVRPAKRSRTATGRPWRRRSGGPRPWSSGTGSCAGCPGACRSDPSAGGRTTPRPAYRSGSHGPGHRHRCRVPGYWWPR